MLVLFFFKTRLVTGGDQAQRESGSLSSLETQLGGGLKSLSARRLRAGRGGQNSLAISECHVELSSDLGRSYIISLRRWFY